MIKINMKDQYKNIAGWYDRIFEPMNSGLRKIGLKMYPVKPGMDILDIGCGTGAHLKLYQDKNCNVFGVDLSPAMLRIAEKKLGNNANLQQINAAETGFADNKFDLILSSTVLHEMSPQVRSDVLKEARRILKNDGRMLIIDFHPGPVKKIKGVYSKFIITLSEILAGRVHYKNYRNFIKNGGLPGLPGFSTFIIVEKRIVSGGNFGIYLLKLK